eukprot:gene8508-26782_t
MEREQDGSLRIGGKIPDARPRRFSFLSCCKPEKENEQEEEEEVEAFETPFMPGGTAEIQAGSSTRSEAPPYLVPQAQSEPVVLEGIGPATADKRPSEFQELREMLAKERAAAEALTSMIAKKGGGVNFQPPTNEPVPAVPPPLSAASPAKSSMKPPELMRPANSVRLIAERREQQPGSADVEGRRKQRFSQTLETLTATAAELNKFKQEEMDVHEDSKHLLNVYKGKKVKVPHAAFIEHVGKPVIVSGVGKGVLEYYGEHKASGAKCAGVSMAEPIGKHDGTVAGFKYFSCAPQHGLLLDPRRIELVDDYIEILDNDEDIGASDPNSPAASAALMKDGSLRIGFGGGSERLPTAPAAAAAAVAASTVGASAELAAAGTAAMERFTLAPPGRGKSKRQASQHGGFGSAGSVRLQSIPAAAVASPSAASVAEEGGGEGPAAEGVGEAFVQLSPGQAASALAKDGSLRIGFGSGSEHGGRISIANKSSTLPAGFSLSGGGGGSGADGLAAEPFKRDGSLQVGFGSSSSTSESDPSARIRSAAAAAAAGDFPPGMSTLKSVSGWNLGDRCTAPGPTGEFVPVVIQGWILDEDEEEDDRAVVRLDTTGVVIVVLLSSLMEIASEA